MDLIGSDRCSKDSPTATESHLVPYILPLDQISFSTTRLRYVCISLMICYPNLEFSLRLLNSHINPQSILIPLLNSFLIHMKFFSPL